MINHRGLPRLGERRRDSADYKQRILAEADRAKDSGGRIINAMSAPSSSIQSSIQSSVQRHLIITVHGIRTFGQWQERLESLVRRVNGSSDTHLSVLNYKFGYFSALAYLSVILRWITVRRFRQELLSVTSGQ